MTFSGIWYLLKREDFCLLVPRPCPANIDPVEREKFQADLRALLAKLGPNDLLLFEDESGYYQSGVPKRKWTRRGDCPTLKVSATRKRGILSEPLIRSRILGILLAMKKP